MFKLLPRENVLKLSIYIITFCLLIPVLFSYADIYRYIDENGVMHFTHKPPNKPGATLFLPQKPIWMHREQYEENKLAQTILLQLGYYQGYIDGKIGPKTRKAIKAFQLYIGVPVTGEVDKNLKSQLEIAKKKDEERRLNDEEKRLNERREKEKNEENYASKLGFNLLLRSWNWKTPYAGDYITINGFVKNISKNKITRLKVIAFYYTNNGDFIENDWNYVEYNTLMPGQSSPFKIQTKYNPFMKEASIGFMLDNKTIKAYRPE